MISSRKIYFICSLLLVVGTKIYTQDITSFTITGISADKPLTTYLNELCVEHECRFFYMEDMLADIYVTRDDNGKQFTEFLEAKLGPKDITFIVYKRKNLVFVQENRLQRQGQANGANRNGNGKYETTVDVGDPMLSGKYKEATLRGYVRDGKTGEPLIGAVVYVKDRDIGVVTDLSGRYKVDLPIGKHEVEFKYVGFEPTEMQVNMISPGDLDVELFESTVAIDQVVVTSSTNANVTSTDMGMVRMDVKTISNLPVLMGEPDLMKSMTLLPGVQSSGDMSSGFNVRGGNSDQNLILMDEVPLYNSNHLFGMFSIIDTRAIEDLELHKGSAPARYGGRTSSVMSIDLKNGNLKAFKADAGIGLFSSKATIQGPIVKDKASFIIGGRTSYSDWILNRVPDLDIRNSSAGFYDLNMKLNYTLNPKNRFNLYAYISNDDFNFAGRNRYQYQNQLGSFKWNRIINDKLTHSLTLLGSRYETFTAEITHPAKDYSVANSIFQTGAKYRLLFSPGSKHAMEGGIEANQYDLQPGIRKPYGEESLEEETSLDREKAYGIAAYLQDEYKISSGISLSVGLRYSTFMQMGPAEVNEYDGEIPDELTFSGTRNYASGEIIQEYNNLEPRLGLRIKTGPLSSFKIGYSRNAQYLHRISNTTVVTPSDIWKSSGTYIEPAIGDQMAVGYFHNFMKGIIETSAEVYYKQIRNVVEYKPGAVLLMNESLEQDLLDADMEAYGIELLFRKNAGRLTGWLSYSYSRSFLQTTGAPDDELINGGDQYPAYFDKPHDISLVTNIKLSRRFTLGSSFTYSTGRPATYPESVVFLYNNPLLDFSDERGYTNRNKYRYKDYHRLDVSLTWDPSLRKNKKFYSTWSLSVYNVYGRQNMYSAFYKKDIPSAKNNYNKFAFYRMSIIGVPIPSITYNVRF